MIVSVCTCSCDTTSFLKKASISSLNTVLFLSRFFSKSSWENSETKVESSFVIETVDDAVSKSYTFF